MEAPSHGHHVPSPEALDVLLRQVAASGGIALGPVAAEEQPRWAAELIRQFNEAGTKTGCPHLRAGEHPAIWMSIAPDLLACTACRDELVARVESRLGHSLRDEPGRCSVCGEEGRVRGVSVAAGSVLLRGLLCASCEADPEQARDAEASAASQSDVNWPEPLQELGLPPIAIDFSKLAATEDRSDFDEVGWHMLIRAGRLCERLIERVQSRIDQRAKGLTLDEAVVGGLLVRAAKQTRAIFDSTQAEQSEAHSPLSRCLAETAITLRWLVWKSDPATYRRFRADSFARWRAWLEHAAASTHDEDATARRVREAVERHIASELAAAGLSWDEVPPRPNSWGPDLRRRFEDLDQGWLYDTLFVTHSSYVHPTWHEIRAFHLTTTGNGIQLDYTYAGIAPIAAYVLARMVAEACKDAASMLPHDLPVDAFDQAVDLTVRASQHLAVAFTDFMGRCGIETEFGRHSAA